MFKKHLISMMLTWFFLLIGCFVFLYTSSSNAKMAYQNLMGDSNQSKKESLQDHPTKQVRQQVSKQIFYKKNDHRMQSRLASESSELVYSKKQGELVENFKNLKCIMQEEFLDASANQQKIRQLEAKEAVYFYQSGQLEAKNVNVSDYFLPGYLWPHSFKTLRPSLQGKAQTIQLTLFKEPTLKAQGFQAIFHDWREEW